MRAVLVAADGHVGRWAKPLISEMLVACRMPWGRKFIGHPHMPAWAKEKYAW